MSPEYLYPVTIGKGKKIHATSMDAIDRTKNGLESCPICGYIAWGMVHPSSETIITCKKCKDLIERFPRAYIVSPPLIAQKG